MSLQIRVLIEVAPSETEAANIRVEQVETVMPANANGDDVSDLMALGDVTVCRLAEECVRKTRDQLVQIGGVLAEGIGA